MIPLGLFLSPFVVAQRMPRLWWEALGGNAFGPRESTMMLSEKLEAAQFGVVAAQREAVRASLESGVAAMRGQPVEAMRILGHAPSRITKAALNPAAKRVSANLKRLKKR
jgi:hypothetical protein